MNEQILVIDDNPTNLKLARILLDDEGYDVQTADTGEQAIALLATGYRPRLILLDLHLPGIDGLSLMRKLKRDDATKDILVVAWTASAMKGDEATALESGCDGYITKPIDGDTLHSLVRRYLDRG
jgi:CheY-like chemotaxis protein